MAMKRLSQRDPKWSAKKLGKSSLTVGRWGCTTTCVSMLSDYFGQYVSPEKLAAKKELFTADGRIIWLRIKDTFTKFRFVYRYYTYTKANSHILFDAISDPKKASLVTVDSDSHWLVPTRKSGSDIIAADPWTGKDENLLKKYGRISGFVVFERA